MKIENVAVISLEDYAEYQRLKADKNKVDISKLKTGSIVRLKYSDEICCNDNRLDYNKTFEVVFFKTKHGINGGKLFFVKSIYESFCTFYQNGNFVLFASDKNTDYITEVISY